MNWLDLLAVQGPLESSPTTQFKSINSLHSAFFIVQLSHPYMTTGKTIALTRLTLVGRVMSLLFNLLSSLVMFPSKKASFNFMAAITICHDFGATQNKVSHCFPICFSISRECSTLKRWPSGSRIRRVVQHTKISPNWCSLKAFDKINKLSR